MMIVRLHALIANCILCKVDIMRTSLFQQYVPKSAGTHLQVK